MKPALPVPVPDVSPMIATGARAGRDTPETLHDAAPAGLEPAWIGVLAAAAFATFPMATSLGRQAMPEPFLTLWAALALWAAIETRGFTRTGPTLLLAAVTLAGALTKQTFPLYVAGPLVALSLPGLRRHPARVLPRLALWLALAAPLPLLWLGLHREAQQAYALQSTAAKAPSDLIDQLAYYPVVLAGTGVGLLWTGPLLLGMALLATPRRLLPGRLLPRRLLPRRLLPRRLLPRRLLPGRLLPRRLLPRRLLPLVLLLSVVATLTVMPRKYPRLIVPALPLAAATLAIGLGQLHRRGLRRAVMAVSLIAGALQQAAVAFPTPLPSSLGLWEPPLLERIDPGCPQVWIRRPSSDDLGFDAVIDALRAAGGTTGGMPVVFVLEPEIPCRYETTFGYTYHLAEYARRRGLELGEIPVAGIAPARFREAVGRARLVVDTGPWCEGDGGSGPDGIATPDPTCAYRGQFMPAGRFTARSDWLRFTLAFYRRIAP
jgi:hypothetical protein